MAFDAFIKIGDIKGESLDDKHKGEIDVLSFTFGISRKNEGGRPNIHDFTILKHVDSASPQLFDVACQGEPVRGETIFTARKAGEKPLEFLKIKMEDVIITSIQHAGTAGPEGLPMESVALDFRSVEIEAVKQNPDGSAGGTTKSECNARRRD
jgi:type VI secretion system secreted protein Hcp